MRRWTLTRNCRKSSSLKVPLDYLRERDFDPVPITDEYFARYDVSAAFTVRGETVIVENERLAAALLRLPEK